MQVVVVATGERHVLAILFMRGTINSSFSSCSRARERGILPRIFHEMWGVDIARVGSLHHPPPIGDRSCCMWTQEFIQEFYMDARNVGETTCTNVSADVSLVES